MSEPSFSDVGICNSGILKVGGQQIASLDDNTRTSNTCKALYATLRDELMRAVPWRFALQQVVLGTPAGTPPSFQYTSAYDIPSNVLRVVQVVDGAGYPLDAWTEIGNQVLCNKADGINTISIVQNTDPTTYDAQFAETLSWRIAMELAMSLVQSSQVKKDMESGYKAALAQARSSNAVIGTPERLIADFWSGARKYGVSRTWPVAAGPPEPYGP